MNSAPGCRQKGERNDKRPLLADGLGLLLLIALTPLLFWQIALAGQVLPGVDAFTYFYPYRAYAAQEITAGHVPLWNPYLFMGVPFLANSQAAVLYPLNLALSWLQAPALLAGSIVIHVIVAAVGAYTYARHVLRISPLPALLAAGAFAYGGFLTGQVEHVNQLNVSAWFPLLLLLWELRRRWRWPALAGIGMVVGIGLLAGHAQSSYISVIGLIVYAALPALGGFVRAIRTCTPRRSRLVGVDSRLRGNDMFRRAVAASLLRPALDLGVVVLLGAGLAAVQLLPTLELTRLSIRGGGLSYREAVAFSLKPLPGLLRYTFLPPWSETRGELATVFGGEFFSEYLAYVGTLPLLLCAGLFVGEVLRAVARHSRLRGNDIVPLRRPGERHTILREAFLDQPTLRVAILALTGFFLALGVYNPLYLLLYKLLPGFGLFRVPARWLLLYAFGTAMLSGAALQRASDWLKRRIQSRLPAPLLVLGQALIVLLSLVELLFVSRVLAFNHATAPEALTSLRTAPAHLIVAQRQQVMPGRFLSMSDTLFDPGDLVEIQRIFRDQLPESAVYDYVVCTKRKEILAPNLPLLWGVYGVDGYDGGVLPLSRYIQLQRLFLEEDEILIDGRLRERLARIPPSRLLSILGVQYVLTDKVHDVWIEDVFYDLAFEGLLGQDAAPSVAADVSTLLGEPYISTSVGIVSYLEGGGNVPDGVPVAEIRLTTTDGDSRTLSLRAGRDTSEGLYEEGAAHAQAQIGVQWSDAPGGAGYIARLRLDEAIEIARLEVVALPFGGRLHVRGVSLIDERDGSSVPLILSTDGAFQRVHSGDVKIYEVLDALPRAYVVHQTRLLDDDAAAIQAMADPAFDPARTAILAAGTEIEETSTGEPTVTVTEYEPQRVTLQASLSAPGYLIVGDTWYPGWQATVDAEAATIERANVHFRAVYLPEGTHTVRFTYKPKAYLIGVGITLLSLACLGLGWIVHLRSRRRAG